MELVVVAVLRLAAESRDCGRRSPVLWIKGLPLVIPSVGDAADVDAIGRNAVGPEGLEVLRRSLSLSLFGGGESSMMSTHPDESAEGAFFFSTLSALRLCETPRSSEPFVFGTDLPELVEEEAVAAMVDVAIVFTFGRPVRLPIRNRGTRV